MDRTNWPPKPKRFARSCACVRLVAVVVAFAVAGQAEAQVGPGGAINPQRDCHQIVTCNFKRGGRFRGCVSSYSCRVCRMVTSNCRIGGERGRVCRRVRCGWGA